MRAAALCALAFATVWPSRRWAGALCALAGAVGLVWATWTASFERRDNQWAALVAVAVVPAMWWATSRVHRRLDWAGGAWGLLIGSALAVYGCVPETDQMRDVAVVLVAGWLAEVVRGRPLPDAAWLAAGGLVAWSALYGATGRPSALVGGLFALVPAIAVAVVPARRPWVPWTIGVVWAAAAVAVARTGGIATDLTTAVRWAAVLSASSVVISAVVWRIGVHSAGPRTAD